MRLLATLVLLGAFITLPAFAADQFSSEDAAQRHCPTDVVVWLNLPTSIYHFKGQRWYGKTKSGAYVCQKEADKDGARATRNGE